MTGHCKSYSTTHNGHTKRHIATSMDGFCTCKHARQVILTSAYPIAPPPSVNHPSIDVHAFKFSSHPRFWFVPLDVQCCVLYETFGSDPYGTGGKTGSLGPEAEKEP